MSSIQPTKQRVVLHVPVPHRASPTAHDGSVEHSQGAAGEVRGHLAAAGVVEGIQPLLLQLQLKRKKEDQITLKDCI